MKLITYSLIGIALVGQQAVAEEKTIQNFDDKTWYFSAGYSTSLWSSDKWHDPSTGGSTNKLSSKHQVQRPQFIFDWFGQTI